MKVVRVNVMYIEFIRDIEVLFGELVEVLFIFFFFFKQKTAYEIYQCDWSSDVCSSDLVNLFIFFIRKFNPHFEQTLFHSFFIGFFFDL